MQDIAIRQLTKQEIKKNEDSLLASPLLGTSPQLLVNPQKYFRNRDPETQSLSMVPFEEIETLAKQAIQLVLESQIKKNSLDIGQEAKEALIEKHFQTGLQASSNKKETVDLPKEQKTDENDQLKPIFKYAKQNLANFKKLNISA